MHLSMKRVQRHGKSIINNVDPAAANLLSDFQHLLSEHEFISGKLSSLNLIPQEEAVPPKGLIKERSSWRT